MTPDFPHNTRIVFQVKVNFSSKNAQFEKFQKHYEQQFSSVLIHICCNEWQQVNNNF
jgi:uncharacterized protein YihD (DUF1040 family)